jgi:FG-GAP repeat
MASKLRFSLATRLLAVVLSAAGTALAGDAVPASDTGQTADAAPATQPSCTNSAGVFPTVDETDQGFGASVAISGQTALVGIPQFTTAFIDPPVPPPFINGRVAVFTCDASTQAWTRTGSIQVSPAEASEEISFGTSVALQGDLAVVGASDLVYVFKRQGQNWNQVLKIVPPQSSNLGIVGGSAIEWGPILALSDDVLALKVTEITTNPGPGGVGIQQSTSYFVDLYQIITLGDRGVAIRIARLKPPAGDTGVFGASLALKGNTLVVGDPPDTTAYVYKRRGITFTLDQKLTPAEATPSTGFGTAVALSKDVILVGAPGENAITTNSGVISAGGMYAFGHKAGPDSPWVETQHFTPATLGYTNYSAFGGSVAVNRNGQAVIGTPQAFSFGPGSEYGPTFLYTLQGGQFALTTIVGTGAPVDVLGMTDEYLITGAQYFVDNFPVSGAGIKNLSTLTN